MTRLAYIDAIGGLAGDMLLGALLHAGADAGRVQAGLAGLTPERIDLRLTDERRHGIAATGVTVSAPAASEAELAHRTWADVRELLDAAQLPGRARARAHAVFAALAHAEARVHRSDPDSVHFHEVGAIDAIADVCGIALALEDLGVDELRCSPLPLARGFTDAAHGRLPLPAPATIELLRGAPVHGTPGATELVTPTGAAVVAALASGFGPLPAMRLEATGYGAGTRDTADVPNLVRVLVGEPLDEPMPLAGTHEAVLIETNLDDLSPELVPDATQSCFAAGALDVWVTAAAMKKGRPGIVLAALARPAQEQAVATAILRETSALGVRVSRARRYELQREWLTVRVGGEAVRVKLAKLDGATVNLAPEHDDCAAVAAATGRPVKEIWMAALTAAAAERAR